MQVISLSRMHLPTHRLPFCSYVWQMFEHGIQAKFPLTQGEATSQYWVKRGGTMAVRELRGLPQYGGLKCLRRYSLQLRQRSGDIIYRRHVPSGQMDEEIKVFRTSLDKLILEQRHRIMSKLERLRKACSLLTTVVNDWSDFPDHVIIIRSEAGFQYNWIVQFFLVKTTKRNTVDSFASNNNNNNNNGYF